MSKQFEVQTRTICDGWINTWHDEAPDGTTSPTTFNSFEEALEELDDLLENAQDSFDRGLIQDRYHRSDYRIVETNAVPA
jgi:hypothetical protein